MDQSSDGPFSDMLIDLGDSYNNGFKFKFAPGGKAAPSFSFNAAKAIFDVFGFSDPSDPDLSFPDALKSPTLTATNIFTPGGFEEAPSTSSTTSQNSITASGIKDAFLPLAGPSGDAVPLSKQQQSFVTPLLRTGGFEVFNAVSFGNSVTGRGEYASFGGGGQKPFGDNAVEGGFQQRARGFQTHSGNSDRRQYRPQPWNSGPFDGSRDKSARRPNVNGFGRSNEDIALLRTRSGAKGKSSCNKKRNNGFGSAPVSKPPTTTTDPKQDAQEQPKESTEQQQPFDAGVKRSKSFGDSAQGMEIAHKRPRLSCGICGRAGHSTDHCYSAKNRDSLRCYNCNNIGHLAVRCPERVAGRGRGAAMPGTNGGGSRGGAGRYPRKPNNVRNGGNAEENKADGNNSGKSESGLGLICQLMQDARMRKETQRHTPKLYDDMLTFMLEHVKI